MLEKPLAENHRCARPRRQRCDIPTCSQYGRVWTLHPRYVAEGLVAWDDVQCVGCGGTPVIESEPSITVITVPGPPIEVDFGDSGDPYPAGKHTFSSTDELRAFAAEHMGLPVEQVIVELASVDA